MNDTDLNGNLTGFNGRKGRMLVLSSSVDLESRLSVGCAGAVITCLQRRKAVNHITSPDNTQSVFIVSAISMFNLDKTMYVATMRQVLK